MERVLKLLAGWKGYVVALAGGVMVAVLAFLNGRRAGRDLERQERESEINKQAGKARQEVRDVQMEVARKDDDAVAAGLKSRWVRGPGGKGRG